MFGRREGPELGPFDSFKLSHITGKCPGGASGNAVVASGLDVMSYSLELGSTKAAFLYQPISAINYGDDISQVITEKIVVFAASAERFKFGYNKYRNVDEPDPGTAW